MNPAVIRLARQKASGFFRTPRTSRESLIKTMENRPGRILTESLDKMKQYLVTCQGGASSEEMGPMVEAYLTSVFLPSVGTNLTLRNKDELRTLAFAADSLLKGEVLPAVEALLLRFQAVEMAHFDGGWHHAKHLTPLAESVVSSIPRTIRDGAIRDEHRELKVRNMSGQKGKGDH